MFTIELTGGNNGRNIIFSGYSDVGTVGQEYSEMNVYRRRRRAAYNASTPTPEPTLEPTFPITLDPTPEPTEAPTISSLEDEVAKLTAAIKRDAEIAAHGSGYGP